MQQPLFIIIIIIKLYWEFLTCTYLSVMITFSLTQPTNLFESDAGSLPEVLVAMIFQTNASVVCMA